MIPLNTQPQERAFADPDGKIQILKMWHTIQGEGPFNGLPAFFIRLAGCNLQCPACDTDYTSSRTELSPRGLSLALQLLKHPHQKTQLVVMTGGEPLRQDIGPAVKQLINDGFSVQIETNGTFWQPFLDEYFDPSSLVIVCSPKTPKIDPRIFQWIANGRGYDAFKFVVKAGAVDIDGLPLEVLGYKHAAYKPALVHEAPERIFIQPEDDADPEMNAANLRTAVEVCLTHGYRLCLQTHKIAGLE